MARSASQRKAEAAWDCIEALGGQGVWDAEVVFVSFAHTGVTDEDLALFRDFPFIRGIDLSHTAVGDAGLSYLAGLRVLDHLIVIDTRISEPALEAFRHAHPSVEVTTAPPPEDAVNPFTGKPV